MGLSPLSYSDLNEYTANKVRQAEINRVYETILCHFPTNSQERSHSNSVKHDIFVLNKDI